MAVGTGQGALPQGATVVAPGANRSGAVFLLGGSLILANMFMTGEGGSILHDIFTVRKPGTAASSAATGTGNTADLIVQILLLLAATLIASANSEAGTIILLIFVAMWLGFLIRQTNNTAFLGGIFSKQA